SVSTSLRRTFFPSQLRKTDSSTMRILIGNREILRATCSSSAGTQYRNPSRQLPASNFFSVLNSSFISKNTERIWKPGGQEKANPDLKCFLFFLVSWIPD